VSFFAPHQGYSTRQDPLGKPRHNYRYPSAEIN
jgi:hypothetical protein